VKCGRVRAFERVSRGVIRCAISPHHCRHWLATRRAGLLQPLPAVSRGKDSPDTLTAPAYPLLTSNPDTSPNPYLTLTEKKDINTNGVHNSSAVYCTHFDIIFCFYFNFFSLSVSIDTLDSTVHTRVEVLEYGDRSSLSRFVAMRCNPRAPPVL
jgi:hypothetical protein